MKVNILDTSKNKIGQIELPMQFSEEIRPDLVARAVLALQSQNRQNYGTNPGAGKRASAVLSRRRRKYRGSYGLGIARTPRKIMSRSGMRFNWVGAFAPNTVGGRRSHPPKSEKIWQKKINKKERRKAIRSAIAATMAKEFVSKRGHRVPEHFPFIVDEKIESIEKTKEMINVLVKLGFENELERTKDKKVRTGRGKARGRKYKTKKGILIVVSNAEKVRKAAENIPGMDVAEAKNLNAELLAPGAMIGRLTLWTKPAVEMLEKEKSFLR